MKVIIDIDEKVRNTINQMGLYRIPEKMQKVADRAIQFGTPIPDNATNGEVIKTIFEPNINKRHNGEDIEAYYFDTVWWNAPYQKGGE